MAVTRDRPSIAGAIFVLDDVIRFGEGATVERDQLIADWRNDLIRMYLDLHPDQDIRIVSDETVGFGHAARLHIEARWYGEDGLNVVTEIIERPQEFYDTNPTI